MTIDAEDGGRWTSLMLAGREWLWSGPGLVTGPRTGHTAFTDAGGLDECYPTVRGTPDHGALWNQPWSEEVPGDDGPGGPAHTIAHDGATLTRALTTSDDSVTVDYHLTAPAGYQFVWAAHALLDCEVGATIHAQPTECRLYPEAAPLLAASSGVAAPWATGAPWVSTGWPTLGLDNYGPSDGTAVGAVLVDAASATVRDRGFELTMTLDCPGQPVSTALWRNLAGFPDNAPYRSLGVEPMLGRVFDLAEAGPGDAAVVPDSGELAWRLTLSARPV